MPSTQSSVRSKAPWNTIILAVIGLVTGIATSADAQNPQAFEWPDPQHQLLLLGTFHFSDAGLDSYRPQYDVDVLSPERQTEIGHIVDRLTSFRPTRIAVEVMPEEQAWLDSLYRQYRAGNYELGSNEVFQLGFRLARLVGHDRVYAVDADRRFYEPWVDPDEYAVAHGQQRWLDPGLELQYQALYQYDDSIKVTRPLAEHLLYVNSRERTLRSHGRYLIDSFEVGTGDEYPGVDSRTAWFNRNLKIFANLQRLVEGEHERVLLIIGAGHLAILRHSAEASPQFEFVELTTVLEARER